MLHSELFPYFIISLLLTLYSIVDGYKRLWLGLDKDPCAEFAAIHSALIRIFETMFKVMLVLFVLLLTRWCGELNMLLFVAFSTLFGWVWHKVIVYVIVQRSKRINRKR